MQPGGTAGATGRDRAKLSARLARAPALVLAFLICLGTAAGHALASDRLEVTAFRIAADAARARVIFNFDREPELHWFLLNSPHRLVVDLAETGFAIDPQDVEGRGMIDDVQYGQIAPGTSRIILTADTPFDVERLDVVKNEDAPGHRLVIEMAASSQERFDAALADQALTTASTRTTPKVDRLGAGISRGARPFTIVIDPGHGGIDSGARGVNGTLEKTITLAFALELKARLDQDGRYAVHLTRDRDLFLRLDERVRIARQHDADLFISVHADTVRQRGVRGATVYTVSDQASDAEAAALAARENLSDELAGMEIEDANHEVSDILMDLIRRETHSFSIRFARTLVDELSSKVDLIRNPHRFAGFRVLRAPDVPSVLLELGYLSNPDDEERLRDAEWRAGAVDSISSAIDLFAGAHAGAGG